MIDRLNHPKILSDKPNNKNNVNFKGPGTIALSGLRSLANSPAIGACVVDIASMGAPRTAMETINRGPQSGIETAFREFSSTFIHACVGLVGLGAATLLSGKINKDYGIKAQEIFASGDTINNMSALWNKAGGDSKRYFGEFIKSIQGLNGTSWNTVSSDAAGEITENLMRLAEKTKALSTKTGADKNALKQEIKELKTLVVSQITKDTGASASFKLNAEGVSKGVSATAAELVDNAVGLGNSFKNQAADKLPKFVKALSRNKTASTLLGLGICAALCTSIQPINRYLTKKRTGQDGFVGGDGRKADDSKKFKMTKLAMGVTFSTFALRTIGKFKDFVPNVQFNSKIPSINQYKALYGLTICSRFLSARDKDELRESTIKDTLGFTNWLIFGGMVSKLTARALGGKELINNPVVAENGKKGIKYAAKWLTKASVKSFDEVILPKAQELTQDGKLLKFSDLYKKADSVTKSQIKKLAASQVAGYIYSGLVLGLGISKLNIFITKNLESKRRAEKNMKLDNKFSSMEYILKAQKDANSVFKDFI